jgi:hypothetical protein
MMWLKLPSQEDMRFFRKLHTCPVFLKTFLQLCLEIWSEKQILHTIDHFCV